MRKALAQPHTKQFLKFAVVGLISFGIDWGMLIALVELFHLDFLMSTTVSFTTSVVVNYWLSMKYVFDHREGMSRKREFTIFTILSVIGLGLNDLYMFVGVTFLSIGYQAMKAIATFLVTWYNYFSRRFFLEEFPFQPVFCLPRGPATQSSTHEKRVARMLIRTARLVRYVEASSL